MNEKFVTKTKIKLSDESIFSSKYPAFHVRNGNVWAINKDRVLCYANIRDPTFPKFEIIKGAIQVLFIHVSPDGEHCIFRTPEQTYYIKSDNLIPSQIAIIPGFQLTSVTWEKDPKTGEPVAFMSTDGKTILYLNLGKKMKTVQIIQLPVIQKLKSLSPIGLKLVRVSNGMYGLIQITKTHILPYFLDDRYLCDITQTKRTMSIPTIRKGASTISTDGNCIGVWINNTSVLAFELNLNAKSADEMLQKQLLCIIPENTVWYRIHDDLMFVLTDKFIIYYIKDDELVELCSFAVNQFSAADFDPYTCDFYTLDEKEITRYTLPKVNSTAPSFYKYLLESSYRLKDMKISTSLFMHANAQLPRFLSRFTSQERVEIMEYIYNKRQQFLTIKQKKTFATHMLEELVRASLSDDGDKYIEKIEHLYKEMLISKDTVLSFAQMYGAEKLFNRFSTQEKRIMHYLELGESKEALNEVSKLSSSKENDEVFSNCVMRLANARLQDVIDVTLLRGKISNPCFIPILTNANCGNEIINLYKESRLVNPWEYELFMKFALKNNYLNFFKDNKFPEDLKWEAIRTLYEEKKFLDAAYGLSSMYCYVDAALAAAKVSLNDAMNIIRRISTRDKRMNCATRVLHSLNQEEAGNFSRLLLKSGCVDVSIALNYIPDKAHISEIQDTMTDFISVMCNDASKLDEETVNAKSSIRNAAKLNKKPYPFTVNVPIGAKCCICGKSLHNQKMKVFSCKHIVHETCSSDGCPVCGKSAIMNIDTPYEGLFSNEWEIP